MALSTTKYRSNLKGDVEAYVPCLGSSGEGLRAEFGAYSQYALGSYCSLAQLGHVSPVFITQDKSVWLLEELALQLGALLRKVAADVTDYTGLPEMLEMPSLPGKKATLRLVQSERSQFRFFED
jgi:hypothetical protein